MNQLKTTKFPTPQLNDLEIESVKNFFKKFNDRYLYKPVFMKKTGLNSEKSQSVFSILIKENILAIVFTIKIPGIELDSDKKYLDIKKIPKFVIDVDGDEHKVDVKNIFVFYEVLK